MNVLLVLAPFFSFCRSPVGYLLAMIVWIVMESVRVIEISFVPAMVSFEIFYGFVDLFDHATHHESFSVYRIGVL